MNRCNSQARPWPLVLAGGLVMGLALGTRHVQGLFLLPVTQDQGWSRDTFSFAMALQNLVWGMSQPLLGMVADRFGSTRVVSGGLICGLAGLVVMSLSESPIVFTLGAGVLMGVSLSGTAFGAIYGAISRLVDAEQRAWALGVTGAVGGLGQFMLVPAVQWMLSAFGWGRTLLILAAGMLALVPLAWRLNDRPAAPIAGSMPIGGALREAGSHRGFWLLTLGFVACGFQLAFIGNHLPAYLLDRGQPASVAVFALALIALSNVFGTYLCGDLGGRLSRKYLLAWIYLARAGTMALFLLLPLTSLSTYAFAIAMGLLWLGTVPLTNGLLAQVFGVQYIGTLFGIVFLGHQLGSFAGVWLGGLVFEATGSYDVIWIGAMALGVLAAILHCPINDRAIERAVARSAVRA